MSDIEAENQLKDCLEAVLDIVQTTIGQIKSKQISENNTTTNAPVTETPSDINIYSFTLDRWEEDLMDNFKNDIEKLLQEKLPQLKPFCRAYFVDLLNQFNYNDDKKEFTEAFNIGMLDPFVRELKSVLDSIEGYRAAWNGNATKVRQFIKNYPAVKDKSGLWRTTLLYSAAKNNHLDLVNELIDTHQCSVDAQNQQHILRALAALGHGVDYYDTNTKAGSTALHGACFEGYLEVVQCLIEHGADYYIKNQGGETPLMHALERADILNFFRELLVLGYSSKSDTLPQEPIDEDTNSQRIDCIWEYKPFVDEIWYQFSNQESKILQQSLKLQPDKEFQREIHLKVVKKDTNGITYDVTYGVKLMNFLRSGKDLNYAEHLAWVRCRGSSILNFNCYALWQIFLTKHPDGLHDPILDAIHLPTSYDSRFEIHLQTWYFCNAQTSQQLEKAMKYHRKISHIKVLWISENSFKFNLEDFTFTDEQNTITGFLRWVPKMISSNSRHKDEITGMVEYATMTNLNPIPLTTSRLKEVSQIQDNFPTENEEEELAEHVGDEDFSYEDGPIDKTPDTPINDTRSLAELLNIPPPLSNNRITTDDSLDVSPMVDIEPEETISVYINENNGNVQPTHEPAGIEKTNSLDVQEIMTAMEQELNELKKKKDELETNLQSEHIKFESLLDSGAQQNAEYEEKLRQLMQRIETMEREKRIDLEKKTKLEQTGKSIRTVEYINIEKQIIEQFLTPKHSLILNQLHQTNRDVDLSFHNRIPKMTFDKRNHSYLVILVGFTEHHDEFKKLLKRIQTLLNTIQSAKDFYQRYLNRTMYSIIKGILPQVKPRTQIWREYTQLFVQLFQDKNKQYKQSFDDFIDDILKSMIEPCILDKQNQPWMEIREQTDQFMKNHLFTKEINRLKQKALDEFIKENISLQRLKFETEPTKDAISTIEYFIKKVQNEFETEHKHQGYELKHFSLIPKLLERLLLYYSCFKIQLPLYESSNDLLTKIEKHVVTTISTSTGSGKSTLLPALLIAEGYDKVIVTQPRRLPCQLICDRVNETMMIDTGTSTKKLAGWAVSGQEKNPQAKVLYLTDGLLKERLLYDKNLINTHIELNKSVVFFIDEVHERSVNIDLCLALLARLLSTKPELQNKVRLIVSSATLDASVPKLFQKHLPHEVTEFQMAQMKTRYRVEKIARTNKNVLDVVQELCKKRKRHDQILCFVSSVSEVNKYCRLLAEISRGTIVAYPLIQSQHPNTQQANIEHGTIFFSTTVAETSLTFPSLKYVVDTGMINTPVYDIQSKRTILKEVRAAESTLKQRFGRLGRTQPGEYYSLYSFEPSAVPYPVPQICQSDLMNLEFSLRKSPLKKGLNYLQQFLPDSPSQQTINVIIAKLKDLNILENTLATPLTAHGQELAKLPDFGSLAMSKAVLAALKTNKCGHDLVCLASFLGVLNTTTIFRSLPLHFKSSDGDFMTLLNVMNRILSIKQSTLVKDANIDYICQMIGLTNIRHIIKQVLKRYSTLEASFKLSSEFREQAQRKSGDWELIARALLAGYSDNVFVSLKDLQERTHHFVRYSNQSDIAVLDLQSTLTRPINLAPVSLVLARDIRHSTAIRATAILSFVGEIKPEWTHWEIKREIDVDVDEETCLNDDSKFNKAKTKFFKILMGMTGGKISLTGSSDDVLNAEFHLLQQMISESKFTLQELANPNHHRNFERNLESLMKMTRIFNPLIWRWKAQKQADVTIYNNTETKTCDIIVQGRKPVNKKIRKEFESFIGWLQYCAVINHPNAGLSPRVLRPQMRSKCRDIEERIARVTDTKRTPVDLYNGTRGIDASRETRMEVVAWIAICKFDCRLEGGFIRDWIVGHYTARPTTGATNPKGWIEYIGNIAGLNKEVVPCDLDCHLPSHAYFDIHKFQDELYKYGITCSYERQDWRYVLLFDENETTGPFTMDLIEPHIALAQDRIDFDVNNLYVEKDYTHEIGMRIDITKKPYSIELETIVDNIKKKRFQVLRPRDEKMKERIKKMVEVRKWEDIDEDLSVIPEPHWKYHAVLVPLPRTAILYDEVKTKMSVIPNLRIVSIEEIRNPFLEETYEGMKKIIKRQCPHANPNEMELFHGTKAEGIEGITEDGFDDRYYAVGMYGHGAYFADNPLKSHDYTASDSANNNTRVMYYNKVLLGKSDIRTEADNKLMSAPKDCHSVIGKHSQLTEYIVYRYGQALPYLKIIYRC